MKESDSPCLIAVDGGGTSCRVALLCDGVRSDFTTGSANVATDRTAAVRTINGALAEAADSAGIRLPDLRKCPAYLGLAGVMAEADGKAVVAALSLSNAVVADDRSSTVRGALGDSDGAVAGIGTGSFLGRQSNGNVRLIGGYGLGLGDEASGAWLGRALLGRVLHVRDGLAMASRLTDRVLDEFDGAPSAIVAFSTAATPRDYGRFAPWIAMAATKNDATARELMQIGATYISNGLRALGWQSGEHLCLTGGVGPHYQPYLPPDMAACVTAPKGSGLDGALALAALIDKGRIAKGITGDHP
jgi:glucosamine kinase